MFQRIIVHIIVVTLLLQAVADDGWRQAGARPHRPSRRHGQKGERKNEMARQILVTWSFVILEFTRSSDDIVSLPGIIERMQFSSSCLLQQHI
jgi:hypothetical protein